MPKIKQLSSHEAQKIAAGEVVERPANIVKELIENSIDAGATRISLYIEDGGKELIRVVDNGCGMDITDAQLCFERHATSKIEYVDQLESVTTFGFRGEALASIASVSKITLLTKEENSLEGTQVIIEANSIKSIETHACSSGTDISIKDLFFNVPARKKFLKSTQTEWRAIELLFNALCFDYPYIHFSLFTENKLVHNCPATNTIDDRALQVWESQLHKNLIVLDFSTKNGIEIKGVIADYHHYRYDRSNIYCFVNKRWVKNHQLSSAIIKGFANTLPPSRYPFAAISISIPAHEVDINIHPRKEEVKFVHPRRVEMAIQEAVKNALEQKLSDNIQHKESFSSFSRSLSPSLRYSSLGSPYEENRNMEYNTQEEVMENLITQNNTRKLQQDSQLNSVYTFEENKLLFVSTNNNVLKNLDLHSSADPESYTLPYDSLHGATSKSKEDAEKMIAENNEFPNQFAQTSLQGSIQEVKSNDCVKIIGQYNNTYILIEQEGGLFLIDQHAAHERILYELFSTRFQDIATIQLLFPQTITLSGREMEVLLPHIELFIHNGIIIEQSSYNQLIIQSLPVHLKDQSMNDIVKEVIHWITEYTHLEDALLKKTVNNKLQAQMACKAAVKAGDSLTVEKMQQLLDDLNKTANRFSCPHGRPTGWLLSLYEIEKKFKRRL